MLLIPLFLFQKFCCFLFWMQDGVKTFEDLQIQMEKENGRWCTTLNGSLCGYITYYIFFFFLPPSSPCITKVIMSWKNKRVPVCDMICFFPFSIVFQFFSFSSHHGEKYYKGKSYSLHPSV